MIKNFLSKDEYIKIVQAEISAFMRLLLLIKKQKRLTSESFLCS